MLRIWYGPQRTSRGQDGSESVWYGSIYAAAKTIRDDERSPLVSMRRLRKTPHPCPQFRREDRRCIRHAAAEPYEMKERSFEELIVMKNRNLENPRIPVQLHFPAQCGPASPNTPCACLNLIRCLSVSCVLVISPIIKDGVKTMKTILGSPPPPPPNLSSLSKSCSLARRILTDCLPS